MELVRLEYMIEGGDFINAGNASSSLKKELRKLGLDPALIRRIAVSTYEAEVNVVAHAYIGRMMIRIDDRMISVIVTDEGPGIPDINMAMQEGFSTASVRVREMGFGAGMGLANIKKNADSFSITTELNIGTRLEMTWFINNDESIPEKNEINMN